MEKDFTLNYELELIELINKIPARPMATMTEFITALKDNYSDLSLEKILLMLEKDGVRCIDTSIKVSSDSSMKLAILLPIAPTSVSLGPGIVWYYRGGGVSGNRFGGLCYVIDLVQIFGAIVISAEYRLAPEYPGPIPYNDCFEALAWTARSLKGLICYGLPLDLRKNSSILNNSPPSLRSEFSKRLHSTSVSPHKTTERATFIDYARRGHS
jgi:hypothetical protein